MLLKTITCCCCNQEVNANPRLKGNQQYCGKSECQRARKKLWQHEKIKSDEDYKEKQTGYIKRWRREKPFYQYMSQYRNNHADYVESNRKGQQQRNENRRQREKILKGEKIVKMDALSPDSIKTNTYEMTSFHKDSTGKIVKMDTLMVQLRQIQSVSLRQPVFM
jgi:hypothetical protein